MASEKSLSSDSDRMWWFSVIGALPMIVLMNIAVASYGAGPDLHRRLERGSA